MLAATRLPHTARPLAHAFARNPQAVTAPTTTAPVWSVTVLVNWDWVWANAASGSSHGHAAAASRMLIVMVRRYRESDPLSMFGGQRGESPLGKAVTDGGRGNPGAVDCGVSRGVAAGGDRGIHTPRPALPSTRTEWGKGRHPPAGLDCLSPPRTASAWGRFGASFRIRQFLFWKSSKTSPPPALWT